MMKRKHSNSILSLYHPNRGWWDAELSDGDRYEIVRTSFITGSPLILLLWAVRLLLLGADKSSCKWLVEAGQYSWLFARIGRSIRLQIVWFDDTSNWSNEKGEYILDMHCDLLMFAKRLYYQLGQLEYEEGEATVPVQDASSLKEAILAFEHI